MSAFDAEYEPSPWGPIAEEVARYERTDGAEPSEIVGDQWIVLWTLGAKSGKVRKTPLVRVADGDDSVRRSGDEEARNAPDCEGTDQYDQQGFCHPGLGSASQGVEHRLNFLISSAVRPEIVS